MRENKRAYALVMAVFVCVLGVSLIMWDCAPAVAGEQWNCSCWGARRGATELYHWWADEMDKRSGGALKVKFEYGGVLAPAKENLDGIKAGIFEMCMICSHYHPDKVPLHEVVNLPFFAPLDVAHAVQWEEEVYAHPALANWLKEKWNAVVIIPQILPRYEIMSKKPIRAAEDFKGIRIHASKAHGRIIEEYGAVITTITGAEIYNALDRGIVDAVAYPWTYAFGSYKLYEPAEYSIVGINFGIRNMPVLARADEWNALPAEVRKIHKDLLLEAPKKAKELYGKADDKWVPIFKENTEFINFPPEERAKLVKVADTAWSEWTQNLDAKGLPGQEVLDYAKAKYEEVTGQSLKLK
jgi:TRAP-type C4-dicarboxylate transport system substrate-binding protein